MSMENHPEGTRTEREEMGRFRTHFWDKSFRKNDGILGDWGYAWKSSNNWKLWKNNEKHMEKSKKNGG